MPVPSLSVSNIVGIAAISDARRQNNRVRAWATACTSTFQAEKVQFPGSPGTLGHWQLPRVAGGPDRMRRAQLRSVRFLKAPTQLPSPAAARVPAVLSWGPSPRDRVLEPGSSGPATLCVRPSNDGNRARPSQARHRELTKSYRGGQTQYPGRSCHTGWRLAA